MSDETKTTDYLVFATVGQVPSAGGEVSTAFGPGGWPMELWREATVLSVPQRTTRAVVVEQAKELMGELVGEAVAKTRVRIVPLGEVTEAIVELEAQPRLVATLVTPETGAAGTETPAPASAGGDGPLAALTGGRTDAGGQQS